jgi:hypothetical protein
MTHHPDLSAQQFGTHLEAYVTLLEESSTFLMRLLASCLGVELVLDRLCLGGDCWHFFWGVSCTLETSPIDCWSIWRGVLHDSEPHVPHVPPLDVLHASRFMFWGVKLVWWRLLRLIPWLEATRWSLFDLALSRFDGDILYPWRLLYMWHNDFIFYALFDLLLLK